MKPTIIILLSGILLSSCMPVQQIQPMEIPGRWSEEKAWQWNEENGWMAGCNFTPSTAINQLDFWQAETFDPKTINRELGWASDIGFSLIRVYLHNLLWESDSTGLVQRMNEFLDICEGHKLKVMFVLFDDCWYGNPKTGKQPDPTPGIHNSGWLQSPSYADVMDRDRWPALEDYTQGILRNFGEDSRVAIWDLYNEPANNHFPDQIFPLVKNVMKWARQVNPTQPITIGSWKWEENYWPLIEFCLNNSDIISFHNYGSYESMAKEIARHQSFGRPLICTEYLARGFGSRFETHLPLMKELGVHAINWGLVDGKTQTKYPWDHPLGKLDIEPWHHEIFHPDGTPYRQEEVDLIRELCSAN